MPSLGSIGTLIGRGLESPKYSAFLAGAAGLGIAGAIQGHKLSKSSFDYASQALLGTSQADQMIAGTDLGWGNFEIPQVAPLVAAGGAGTVGALAGGGLGRFAGRAIGNMARFGEGSHSSALGWAGTVLGAVLGGTMGAAGGLAGVIGPYTNEVTLHNAFAPNRALRAERILAADNVKKGYNNTDAPNSIFPYGGAYTNTGAAADEDYYANDFPGPVNRPRGYTTGATGDLVLGAYNMRMR